MHIGEHRTKLCMHMGPVPMMGQIPRQLLIPGQVQVEVGS